MTIKLKNILRGLSHDMTVEKIAEKHKVAVSEIEKELKMGIQVEYEHTPVKGIAKRIAMDHLVEIPDYYTRLAEMESDAGGED